MAPITTPKIAASVPESSSSRKETMCRITGIETFYVRAVNKRDLK